MNDHSELERAASVALRHDWSRKRLGIDDHYPDEYANHIVACSPVAVLALIADLKVSTNVGRSLTETLESVCESRDALARAVEQLKADNEELRKDAQRYQWTCIEGNWVARFHGKWRAHIGEYGDKQPTDWYPSRGEAIDAAMGNGEQS